MLPYNNEILSNTHIIKFTDFIKEWNGSFRNK